MRMRSTHKHYALIIPLICCIIFPNVLFAEVSWYMNQFNSPIKWCPYAPTGCDWNVPVLDDDIPEGAVAPFISELLQGLWLDHFANAQFTLVHEPADTEYFPEGSPSTNGDFRIHISYPLVWQVNNLGTTQITQDVLGRIVHAEIEINLVDDIYNNATFAPAFITAAGRHEIGHAIGFMHDGATGNLMYGSIHAVNDVVVQSLSDSEQTYKNSIYSATVIEACGNDQGPAYADSLSATYKPGIGVEILLVTNSEDNMMGARVYRGQHGNMSKAECAGHIIMNSPNGGRYEFMDIQGEPESYYKISAIDDSGRETNSYYIDCVSNNNPITTINSNSTINTDNSKNEYIFNDNYWSGIANGTISPLQLSDTTIDPCTYLIVAYHAYIEELAPICDYWDNHGYDVTLISIPSGCPESGAIKKLIGEYAEQGNCELVWLVGSTIHYVCAIPESDCYDSACELNQIATFYEDSYPTDLPYVDIDDDGYLDLGIARLPAINEQQVSFYVSNELDYHCNVDEFGRKGPEYDYTRLHIIPDNNAYSGNEFTESQYRIADLGSDLYDIMASSVGHARVDGFNSIGAEYFSGDDEYYQDMIYEEVETDLYSGAHILVGVSEHNAHFYLYETIHSYDWPNDPTMRPCHSFVFIFQCQSANYQHYQSSTYSIWNIELFESGSLLFMGPSGNTYNGASEIVARNLIQSIYNQSNGEYDNISLGIKWRDVYNQIIGYGYPIDASIRQYNIIGDPALYIRNSEGITVSVDNSVTTNSVILSPNPFNARVLVTVCGAPGTNYNISVYDIRGRVVKVLSDGIFADRPIELVWDGSNEFGQDMPSSTYFIRSIVGNDTTTKKLVLIR